MNMSKNKTNRFMPFIMAFCVVIGIIIGTFFSNHFSGNRLNVINSGSNRLNNLLHLIDDQYVDAVNIDSLVDKAIPQILAELDPHSVYISAKDAAQATDDLKGSFSGVGVEFVIRQDTIHRYVAADRLGVQRAAQNQPQAAHYGHSFDDDPAHQGVGALRRRCACKVRKQAARV